MSSQLTGSKRTRGDVSDVESEISDLDAPPKKKLKQSRLQKKSKSKTQNKRKHRHRRKSKSRSRSRSRSPSSESDGSSSSSSTESSGSNNSNRSSSNSNESEASDKSRSSSSSSQSGSPDPWKQALRNALKGSVDSEGSEQEDQDVQESELSSSCDETGETGECYNCKGLIRSMPPEGVTFGKHGSLGYCVRERGPHGNMGCYDVHVYCNKCTYGCAGCQDAAVCLCSWCALDTFCVECEKKFCANCVDCKFNEGAGYAQLFRMNKKGQCDQSVCQECLDDHQKNCPKCSGKDRKDRKEKSEEDPADDSEDESNEFYW